MRSEHGFDQAEGLRRLLIGNQTRMIAVVSGKPGVGCTALTTNLAAALARSGKDVLVLDEHDASNNLNTRLKLKSQFDLLDVAKGKCTLQQACQQTQGFSVLSLVRAMNTMPRLSEREFGALEKAFNDATHSVDIVLVDAAYQTDVSQPSSMIAAGVTLLVVVDATASGITESYALIKRLAMDNAKVQFEVVVNKVASDRAARIVFENMAKVAQKHLAARLEYFGFIPTDEKLARATRLSRTVMDAFPDADSALAYAKLAQHFLQLRTELNEDGMGGPLMMQSLMRQMRDVRMTGMVC